MSTLVKVSNPPLSMLVRVYSLNVRIKTKEQDNLFCQKFDEEFEAMVKASQQELQAAFQEDAEASGPPALQPINPLRLKSTSKAKAALEPKWSAQYMYAAYRLMPKAAVMTNSTTEVCQIWRCLAEVKC